MAARDNQSMQIGLIVLLVMTMGLAVGLFLAMKARNTERARREAAETTATNERAATAKADARAKLLQQAVGFPEGDSPESVENEVKEDLTRYGGSVDDANRNYRALLLDLSEENRKLADIEANSKQQLRDVQERLLAVEAQKEEQVKQFEAQMQQVSKDAASEKNRFETQYKEINEKNAELARQMDTARKDYDKKMEELSAKNAGLEQTIRKLEGSISKLQQGLPQVDQFAQPADGQITWANQRQKKVWIDLGSADGIRPQVTFSVSNSLDADAEKSEKKGSIEVVRVIDAHMSEARITNDTATNPLVPGDKIYSQVWDRGRKVGFGIAGFIDIDDNGTSDLEQLKRIIAASNGRVDAAPDDEGKKEGELRIDTRFLVLGDFPTDQPRSDALRASWQSIGDEAEQLGVETIALQEFLKLMGWQNDADAAAMGSGADADDFPARRLDQELPRKTRPPQGVFKKRLPAVGY